MHIKAKLVRRPIVSSSLNKRIPKKAPKTGVRKANDISFATGYIYISLNQIKYEIKATMTAWKTRETAI